MAIFDTAANLANTPAGKPPPGVTPNFAHPHTDGPILVAVGGAFTALALLFLSARIYTKMRLVGIWSPDDTTCMIGAVGLVCYYIAAIFCATAGHFGTHIWDLTLSDLSGNAFVYSGFFTNWTTAVIWPFIKITFFLMYIQIFRPFRWLRYGSYAGILFTILFYFSILVATWAFTLPSPGQTLAESLQNTREAHASYVTIAIGSVGLVLDVYILLLPMAGVSELQLPLRRKLGVMAIFLTGFIACIASSLGIYYRWYFMHHTSDLTFSTMPVILFCLVEMCVGVIASCMPSVSKSFQQFPKLKVWTTKLTSRLSSSWAFSKKGSTIRSGLGYSKQKSSDYKNMGPSNSADENQSYVMAPVKSIRTFVHGGGPNEVEEDGIHLHYKVEQRSDTDDQELA